nr:BON domain-containing protein [Streptomyces sp. NBC_00830]
MIWSRRVAVVARAWNAEARQPSARSRLWVITARVSQALLAWLRADDELAAEIRREVVNHLFPVAHQDVKVSVTWGVATLTGRVRDATLIPVAARLAQSVEGVVSVDCRLEGLTST